jgi:hypothetical protein
MTSKKIKILPLHLSELLPLKIEKKNDNQKYETSIHLGIHTSNTQAGISHGQLLEESGLQPKTLAEILQKAAENYSQGWGENDDVKSFIAGGNHMAEQILEFLYSEITERRDYSASKMCEEVIKFIENNDK